VFVPLPIAADDHQTKNAEVMVRVGAARLIQERDLTAKILADVLLELATDRARTLAMAEAAHAVRVVDAADRVADCCLSVGAAA
jgi:UDP-N-acetylglucosamine--N-acetylmuramyl-(pentapeptide) pyrophosphoryl-undecaprenol N-acetylglucosamine transferase